MEGTPIQEDFLLKELNGFLDLSALSMSQIAGKLDISKTHLSLIKNSKKKPSLNLGLKILKLCNTDCVKRKDWAMDSLSRDHAEYEELEKSVFVEEQKIRLSQKICNRFEANLPLINIYLDIINNDEGISAYQIKNEYGQDGIKLANSLCLSDHISLNFGRYKAHTQRTVLTKQSSFQFMKTVFDDQRDKFESDDWGGKFQFVIEDVSDEGRAKLISLLERTMKEANEIAKEHEEPRTNGGTRIIFQNLVGVLKHSALGILLCLSFINSKQVVFAGGMEGGASISRIRINGVKELYSIEDQLGKLKLSMDDNVNSKYLKRAISDCRRKYTNVRKKEVNINFMSSSIERYWVDQKKLHEAELFYKIKCAKPGRNLRVDIR